MALQILTKSNITVLVYVEADHAGEEGKWNGVLYVLGGPSWKACSGPHGKGAAPKGQYEIERPVRLEGEGNTAFTDKAGNAWFAKLKPLFQTERSGFGIHPDGNVPGTLGCIGLTEPDTMECFQFLSGAPRPTYLFVV